MKVFKVQTLILIFFVLNVTFIKAETCKQIIHKFCKKTTLGGLDEYYDSTSLACKYCKGTIYGCNSCYEERSGSQLFVRCYSCMDGLYLLANQTMNTDIYPETFSFCVPDCSIAHYAYIDNSVTGNCTYCGRHCTSCNLKTGCESCEPEASKIGWVNAFDTDTYSTFKRCQECGSSKWCDECSDSDINSCITCDDEYEDPNNSNTCTEETPDDILYKCNQASFTNNEYCTVCDDGFYVNKNSYCSYCQIDNCLECTDKTECTLCDEGYSTSTNSNSYVQCYDCNDNGDTADFYKDCASCDTSTDTCTGCINGFYDGSNCVSKCPKGQFGQKTYTSRGIVLTSNCEDCDPSCEECIGPDSNECTKCSLNSEYLVFESDMSYGTCTDKGSTISTASYEIFVTPEEQTASDVQNISGDYSDPFSDIEDAINKAYENCAQVTTLCTVTIYLMNGDHYLLRNNRDFYRPTQIDKDSQIIQMTIQPLFCDSTTYTDTDYCITDGNQITVYNKRRDQIKLDVGSGLTIKYIIFDSLDSIILRKIEYIFILFFLQLNMMQIIV